MSNPTEHPAVQTRSLGRDFGDMKALQSLDLRVERGDLFGFIGSNGAGKTTTLRILATFLNPSEGNAEVLGLDVVRDADQVRHRIGYMPDFFGVYKDMEVSEYLDFFGACYRLPTARRERMVVEVLELVGLSGKRGSLIGSLSRGMQQRLGLARVLIHDPELLLLDEPASGLDPRARIEMMAILQELQRMGKTIIISSHILSELQTLCNRCAIIERGRLIYSGPIRGVRLGKEEVRVYRVRLREGVDRARELLLQRPEISGVESVEGDAGVFRVSIPDRQVDGAFLSSLLVGAGLALQELREEEAGLEEVFLQVTKGETQ